MKRNVNFKLLKSKVKFLEKLSEEIIKSKRKIILFSLLVSIVLIIVKITTAYFTNSIGVFSEALNNGLDLVTVLIAFLAIRISTRPADRDHTYGHGKYENLSAIIEIIIISALSFFIIYKSIQRIIFKDFELKINGYIFLILIVSIILNLIRVFFIWKVARKYNSFALHAEFLNYSSDIFSSIVVIIGLYLAKRGFFLADPIASIIIAIVVLIFSLRLSIKVIRNLLDYIPVEITEKINKILNKITEIKEVNKLQIHEVGNIKFLNLDISLDDNLYLSQIETIKRKIKNKILIELPGSDLIIETRSLLSGDKIKPIVREIILNQPDIKGIHNIFVYDIGSGIDISAHIELEKNFKLEETEKITKKAEIRLKEKIKNLRSVYIHIEDLKDDEKWKDITVKSERLINEVKEEIASLVNPETCHNFTLLEREEHYNISFHCRLGKSLNIKKAHNIITLAENKIKLKFKNIDTISIHVEPEK